MQALLTMPSSGIGCENKHHFNKADRRAKDRHQRSEKENKCFHWRELPCKLVSTSSYCSVMIVCILLVCPLLHLTAVMISFKIEDLESCHALQTPTCTAWIWLDFECIIGSSHCSTPWVMRSRARPLVLVVTGATSTSRLLRSLSRWQLPTGSRRYILRTASIHGMLYSIHANPQDFNLTELCIVRWLP